MILCLVKFFIEARRKHESKWSFFLVFYLFDKFAKFNDIKKMQRNLPRSLKNHLLDFCRVARFAGSASKGTRWPRSPPLISQNGPCTQPLSDINSLIFSLKYPRNHQKPKLKQAKNNLEAFRLQKPKASMYPCKGPPGFRTAFSKVAKLTRMASHRSMQRFYRNCQLH